MYCGTSHFGRPKGPGLVDEFECVISVLLAIFCAHVAEARNIGWAAFSEYMVMRSHARESFRRGVLRVIGASAGAAAAWASAGVLGSMFRLSVALACVGVVTLYLALVSRRSYAWLFTGLTFFMVLADSMEHSGESLTTLAWSRFIEVFIGTAACVFVSAISTATVRRAYAAKQSMAGKAAIVPREGWWHAGAIVHAVQSGLALALVPLAWQYSHIEGLSQSGVTIMAVMMVPLASLTSHANQTTRKLAHRFAGRAAGGLLASGILVASHQLPIVMVLGICTGVIVGRHVENSNLGIGYVGTQFALAFLVVLVPDSYANPDLAGGLTRLVGVLFGMLLLEPVPWLFRACARQSLRWPSSG